jgi:hypothetical protein
VTWAGIFNTYYWIDPTRRVGGVIMTQVLPFADQRAVKLYGEFERAIYNALGSVIAPRGDGRRPNAAGGTKGGGRFGGHQAYFYQETPT